MSTSHKNHFVPQGYLRQWAGQDERLCEFSKPHHKVVPKRRHPAETGYQIDLYTISSAPEGERDKIEKRFMQRVDTDAAEAISYFREDVNLPDRLRSGWSRFLMSLMQRDPEKVDRKSVV